MIRLALALLLASSPLQAAQVVRSIRPVLGAPRLAPPAPPRLTLTTPVPTLPTPTLTPAVLLTAKLAEAGALSADLAKLPAGEAGAWEAGRQFGLITGETFRPESGGGEPVPPQAPEPKRDVRLMRYGTAVNKLGVEVVKIGVPILALQTMGSATSVALLAVMYGLAQAGMSWASGWLTDRFPAGKVLAGAIATQGALVAGLAGLSLAGLFSPWVLFPVYALVGATVGVAETTRRVVPPLILGRNADALDRYNGSLHVYYQVAGVAGAVLAGVLIGAFGPLNAMLLHPPAFALAAFLFWKVKHDFKKAGPRPNGESVLADLAAGARAILKTPGLKWVAAAMVLPQVVHRVFEDLLLPVYAKGVLEQPNHAAYMLAASNLGELVGAVLLLKLAEHRPPWVKWSAAGLLTAWALSFSGSLPLLLPLIVVFSATWAASDLTLLSQLQAKLPAKELPRVVAVLLASAVVLGMLGSLAIGRFLDAMPVAQALLWVNGAFTALAAVVYFASKKLSR